MRLLTAGSLVRVQLGEPDLNGIAATYAAAIPFKEEYAPLAQLVEQLTLNQRVLGSSPRWRTNMARWSSGQDGGLSRLKQEFDSPPGHHFSLR